MDIETKVSELCVSCGFCCDGTLFNTAKIYDESDKKTVENLNFNIVLHNKEERIELPCHYFNQCCTIYNNERPKICGAFFCKLIKDFRAGNTPFEKAVMYITEVKKLRKELMQMIQSDINLPQTTLAKLKYYGAHFQEIDRKKYSLLITKLMQYAYYLSMFYTIKK